MGLRKPSGYKKGDVIAVDKIGITDFQYMASMYQPLYVPVSNIFDSTLTELFTGAANYFQTWDKTLLKNTTCVQNSLANTIYEARFNVNDNCFYGYTKPSSVNLVKFSKSKSITPNFGFDYNVVIPNSNYNYHIGWYLTDNIQFIGNYIGIYKYDLNGVLLGTISFPANYIVVNSFVDRDRKRVYFFVESISDGSGKTCYCFDFLGNQVGNPTRTVTLTNKPLVLNGYLYSISGSSILKQSVDLIGNIGVTDWTITFTGNIRYLYYDDYWKKIIAVSDASKHYRINPTNGAYDTVSLSGNMPTYNYSFYDAYNKLLYFIGFLYDTSNRTLTKFIDKITFV